MLNIVESDSTGKPGFESLAKHRTASAWMDTRRVQLGSARQNLPGTKERDKWLWVPKGTRESGQKILVVLPKATEGEVSPSSEPKRVIDERVETSALAPEDFETRL